MLPENHVMQVLHKKFPLHDQIMLCKVLYKEDACTKIIMLCENHVMRGLGITTTIELLM